MTKVCIGKLHTRAPALRSAQSDGFQHPLRNVTDKCGAYVQYKLKMELRCTIEASVLLATLLKLYLGFLYSVYASMSISCSVHMVGIIRKHGFRGSRVRTGGIHHGFTEIS